MERYIIFIRNNKNGDEFVASRRAASGCHHIVMEHIAKRYATPAYTVHTCYTEDELKNILETINRWTGQGHIIEEEKKATPLTFSNLPAHMKTLSVSYKSH